ncbi:hypothetical protein [Myroides indicus]|nr:hypothetical protein [Myroides indicus]
MNKPTKKRMNYNTVVVNRLTEKYGVTRRFVIMSLSGDRESEVSDAIAKDYRLMSKTIDNLLKTM